MACTHPLGMEEIRAPDGRRGVRCPVCQSVAYDGDTIWTLIKRNLFGMNV